MMYTDETLLTFGRYAFTRLCRVPPDYLLKIYENKSHKEITEYVGANMERIIMRKEGIIEAPPFEFPCEKITYYTEKDAKQMLSAIRQKEQEHKKPVRAYECEKCGGWHLTSKPSNYEMRNL